jgi:hypothetical protein
MRIQEKGISGSQLTFNDDRAFTPDDNQLVLSSCRTADEDKEPNAYCV